MTGGAFTACRFVPPEGAYLYSTVTTLVVRYRFTRHLASPRLKQTVEWRHRIAKTEAIPMNWMMAVRRNMAIMLGKIAEFGCACGRAGVSVCVGMYVLREFDERGLVSSVVEH